MDEECADIVVELFHGVQSRIDDLNESISRNTYRTGARDMQRKIANALIGEHDRGGHSDIYRMVVNDVILLIDAVELPTQK